MVPYDFPALLPHLVCHAPWSTPALNWLLGTSQNHDLEGKHSGDEDQHVPPTCELGPNSTPQGEEGKQIGVCVHWDASLSHQTHWAQW
jgi:hypothetical protein